MAEKDTFVTFVYNNKSKIFKSQKKKDLLKMAEKEFNIDMRNMFLFAIRKNERYGINPGDIKDCMKIEIIEKSSARTTNGRTLRSFYTVDEEAKIEEDIGKKLLNNTPLNGIERKLLVDACNSRIISCFLRKRKHSDTDPDVEPQSKRCQVSNTHPVVETQNKRCQVNIFLHNSKDSSMQTDDVVNIESNRPKEQEPEHISQKLKKIIHSGNYSEEEINNLMTASFDDRRNFILLKIPPLGAIRDKYPLLFSYEQVRNELDRINYPGACDQFVLNMEKYSQHILNSFSPNEDNDIYLRTKKSIERAQTKQQKTYARIVGSVFAIAKMLEEDFRFIHLEDYAHGSKDIYPYIDVSHVSLKDIFFDNHLFKIIVEEQTLCEAPNFLEAILCLVAAFFIFNIQYPPSCRQTLIVFEKLYLCANDTYEIDEMTLQMIKMLQLLVKK